MHTDTNHLGYRTSRSPLLTLALASWLGLFALAAATPKPGDPLPAFRAVDQNGKTWSSTDRLGKGWLLLYFYPKDETPGCTKQACGLRDQMGDLQKDGVTVVGVSRDSAESHRAFRAKHDLNFTLLADVDGKLVELFDVAMPDKPLARRVSFLVGKDGKVIKVTDNPNAQVHLDEMKAAIATATAK